jgi:excisionase family DNA binding protein
MPNLLTVQEAAAKLRLSTRTVYSRIRSGELRVVRVSARKFLIEAHDLKLYVDSCRAPENVGRRPSLEIPGLPRRRP